MAFISGFLIIVAICALAVLVLPRPRYGCLRGCTGRALQAVMEREEKQKQEKGAPVSGKQK